MSEQRPALVTEPAPSFRVRSVAHGDAAGIETELELAETDGYGLEKTLAQANGDVVLIFRRMAAAQAEA